MRIIANISPIAKLNIPYRRYSLGSNSESDWLQVQVEVCDPVMEILPPPNMLVIVSNKTTCKENQTEKIYEF